MIIQLSDLQVRLEIKELNKPDEIIKATKEVRQEIENEKHHVMKTNKGVYFYNWKHERTTWRAAKAPIYFDRGDGALYRKTSEGQLKKYTVEDFLKIYGPKVISIITR